MILPWLRRTLFMTLLPEMASRPPEESDDFTRAAEASVENTDTMRFNLYGIPPLWQTTMQIVKFLGRFSTGPALIAEANRLLVHGYHGLVAHSPDGPFIEFESKWSNHSAAIVELGRRR